MIMIRAGANGALLTGRDYDCGDGDDDDGDLRSPQ